MKMTKKDQQKAVAISAVSAAWAERCSWIVKETVPALTEYNSHTQTLSNGGKLIRLYGSLYDYFHGFGWNKPTRIKIVPVASSIGKGAQIQHISGFELSDSLKLLIIQEKVI